MKQNMNLTLNHSSKRNTTVESIIQFINELIDCVISEKKVKAITPVAKAQVVTKSQASSLEAISACLKLRKDRKAFERLVNEFLKDFDQLSDKQQAEIEMHFYNAIIKLEKIVPSVKAELNKRRLSVRRQLFNRELRKTLKVFRSAQKTMSVKLYPDNSQQILSNPAEYQELVDFWGDLAD